jgi:hypothetical protein
MLMPEKVAPKALLARQYSIALAGAFLLLLPAASAAMIPAAPAAAAAQAVGGQGSLQMAG